MPASIELLPKPFAWIEIPTGQVTLIIPNIVNYTAQGKAVVTDEVPAYAIAKYPVTNAQFALFMEAGGYQQPRWWTEAGWQQREANSWTEPYYWQDRQWNSTNHPVVGVSWYEAVAYCNWLSEMTGEHIMLPTEQQWQRAVQGDDGRIYPWGNEWDCQRCNNSVNPCSSNQTTPVTAYEGKHKGDSSFGVVDMTGNVWEWCSTTFETTSPEYAERDFRVIRGGAWDYDDVEEFLVENRGRGDALWRSFSIGFRLVYSL